MTKKHVYILEGLECGNCANKIEISIKKIDNIKNVVVNFNTSKLSFESDNKKIKDKITKMINNIEPDIKVREVGGKQEFKINKTNLFRLVMGIIIGSSTLFLPVSETIKTTLIIISYLILLPRTFVKAIKILIRNKSLDENALITISVIGAFLIGESFEGFMVIGLYEIGKFLEELAVNKSKKSVSDLMDIKPEYANLKKGETIEIISPEEVKIGDIIVVKVGEKIPLDGIVISGSTHVDNSALTGESNPVDFSEGDVILSGGINITNVIEIRVNEIYQNSTVSKILDLVENATNRKAKSENFVSRAAKVYTPIIMILAILTAVLLPLLTNLSINEGIYRALSFLVISCPCAIAISVPLSYFSGIGLASKKGILIKGSDYLDNLRNIKTIIFDKTGTLTTGEFTVDKIVSYDKKI